jgi:hypothetical protein
MKSDEGRWEEAWFLWSLDLTRPFKRELWILNDDVAQCQAGIRRHLDAAFGDQIEYVTNYGAIHYRISEWFISAFGQAQFNDFEFWTRYLLGRALGRQWSTLTQRLADPHYEAPAPLMRLCALVTAEYRRGFDVLKSRIESASAAVLSSWDAKALAAVNRSAESVFTALELVIWSNLSFRSGSAIAATSPLSS